MDVLGDATERVRGEGLVAREVDDPSRSQVSQPRAEGGLGCRPTQPVAGIIPTRLGVTDAVSGDGVGGITTATSSKHRFGEGAGAAGGVGASEGGVGAVVEILDPKQPFLENGHQRYPILIQFRVISGLAFLRSKVRAGVTMAGRSWALWRCWATAIGTRALYSERCWKAFS